MSNMMTSNKGQFSDYIYILYKWKKFILINMSIVIALSTIYAFLIPETFQSKAVITTPPESSGSGLSSLLGGKNSALSLGYKLFASGAANEDVLLGILNSRTCLVNAINKFDLIKYYEVKDNNIDKTIKAFQEDVVFDTDENNFINITVVNKDKYLSAKIANYFVYLLDSMNIKLNVEAAKNNREFIETRYRKNLADLKIAEDNFYKFQKKYGIFAVPEQLEVSVKAAAELEAQLIEKEMQSTIVQQQFGSNSPQYTGIMVEVNMLRDKVKELKSSDRLGQESNVLFPFKIAPDIMLEYLRNYREVEIQNKILELMLPMYEQACVEEHKSIPTVMVIDKAEPAQVKYQPKKAFVILGISLLFFFILLIGVFRFDGVINLEELPNPLVEKEKRHYLNIKRFYRLKF